MRADLLLRYINVGKVNKDSFGAIKQTGFFKTEVWLGDCIVIQPCSFSIKVLCVCEKSRDISYVKIILWLSL